MYKSKYIKYKNKYLQLQQKLREDDKSEIKPIKDGQSKYLFRNLEQKKSVKLLEKYGLDKIEVSSKKIVGKNKETAWIFVAKKYPNLLFQYTLKKDKASLVYRNRPASITFEIIKLSANPVKQFSINLIGSTSGPTSSSPSKSKSGSDDDDSPFYSSRKSKSGLDDDDSSSSSSESSSDSSPNVTTYTIFSSPSDNYSSEQLYSVLPPVSHNYFKIIYADYSQTDIAKANISRFQITRYRVSEIQTIMYGSTQRQMFLFTSTTYPQFLFLSITDTYPDGKTKNTLYYRNIPTNLEYYNNYIRTEDPRAFFNQGLIGMENW